MYSQKANFTIIKHVDEIANDSYSIANTRIYDDSRSPIESTDHLIRA